MVKLWVALSFPLWRMASCKVLNKLTDQRIIFQGDSKSFAAKFEKILEVQPAMDGIRLSETNRQKPRAVMYDHPNGDFVCEVLSYLMEHRSSS